MCGLSVAFCYSWLLKLVCPFVSGVNLQDDWLWENTSVTFYESLCSVCLSKRSCFHQEIVSILLLDVLLVWLFESRSGMVWNPPLAVLFLCLPGKVSGACWCQPFSVRGLGPSALIYLPHYLMFVAASIEPRCAQVGPCCVQGSTSCSSEMGADQ